MLTIYQHNNRLLSMLKRAIPIVDTLFVSQRRRELVRIYKNAEVTPHYADAVSMTFAVRDLWPIVYEPSDNYKSEAHRLLMEEFRDIIRTDYLAVLRENCNAA